MHPKANEQKEKKTICKIFHQKKKSESFDAHGGKGGGGAHTPKVLANHSLDEKVEGL